MQKKPHAKGAKNAKMGNTSYFFFHASLPLRPWRTLREAPLVPALNQLLPSVEERADDAFPQCIALLVHVQPVGDEDLGARLPVGPEHLGEDIDEGQPGIGLRVRGDGLIDGLDALDLRPPGRVGV